jgi:hypothetical protein
MDRDCFWAIRPAKDNDIMRRKSLFLGVIISMLIMGCFTLSKANTPSPASRIAEPLKTSHPSLLYQTYYGHLHNHSTISDGKGTPDQAYAHARDQAGLDFFGLADHAEKISSAEWAELRQTAQRYNEDHRFVAFWGFEWSSSIFGHVTVVNSQEYCASSDPDVKSFDQLVSWLEKRDVIAFFNHPGRHAAQGMEFNHFNSAPSVTFVGMELWNKNDFFKRYYYNNGYDPHDGGQGYFDEALQRRWRIGAAGSEDNHKASWGKMNDARLAVLALEKTHVAIYRALQARRFFSTLDKNLKMSFTIDGQPMGAVLGQGVYPVSIQLSDPDGEVFSQIELLKEGKVLSSWSPQASRSHIAMPELHCTLGEYYYLRVTQADGDQAISSPIWIAEGTAQQRSP